MSGKGVTAASSSYKKSELYQMCTYQRQVPDAVLPFQPADYDSGLNTSLYCYATKHTKNKKREQKKFSK